MIYAIGYAASLVAQITGGLGVGVALWRDRGFGRLSSSLWRPLLALALLFALSALAGGGALNPVVSLFGLIGAFAFVKAFPDLDPSPALKVVGVALSVVTIGESFILGGRPALWANPNELASWLILLLPYTTRRTFPLLLTALIATQSRAALLGVMVMGAAWWWYTHRSTTLTVRSPFFIGAVVVGVLLVLGALTIRPATVADRVIAWGEALQMWSTSPLWGWGVGNYRNMPRLSASVPHADSLPMTLLAETGLLGWVVILPLLRGIWQRATASTHPARWALVAVAVQNVIDAPLYLPVSCLLLGVALALLDE